MRNIRSVLTLLVIGTALAACASGATSLPNVGAPVDGGSGGLGAASAAPPAPANGSDSETPAGENANQVGARDDAKIIRTGSIDLEVTNVGDALRVARNVIVGLGGYVGASSTSNADDDQPTAEITYRIPSDRWEEALDALRGLNGLTTKVAREQTQAVEVTGQVVDLEARIRNLRASETALQGIAANATRISDVLEVETRLTDVRGQIEQLTAALESLNDQASYATLTVYFSMPVVAVEVASSEWQPAKVVDEAAARLISIGQGLATAGIWFLIVWVPSLALIGLLAMAGVWVARRLGLHLPRRAPESGAVADGWR
jgi:hypothetical protein